MRKLINFKRKMGGDDMSNIEMLLGAVMQPVSPRQEFVQSLQAKIINNAFPDAVRVEKQTKKNIAVLILSLMGVAILLGVWIRVVVSLLTSIGLNPNSKQGPRKRRITAVQSAV